ncbi:hypothetical protein [Amycolatopsis sp. PS_44_ISF1]|uniref:hypothetical protein n=1 Tax=Amycolatopsis sp. PS_44_ISF1 TaxID=2974917 RepID=UPI0028DED726|nr:hypothetical protein [Amycolatopsis sp. PS_44_ISF1]MDT8911303.1 hypothetical protein [Amycolatopsis sp. PS_44_ISF1]
MPRDDRRDARAARRLDEIFGDVLPETTSDERDEGDQDRVTPDSWYLENRPPHHDR